MHDVYTIDDRVPLNRLKHLYSLDRADLKDPVFLHAVPASLNPDLQDEDYFSVIKRKDVLLHHPYDSFQPVITFLKSAAKDPAVLAIKMTLYRIGKNSPVVEALLKPMNAASK